MCVGRYAAKVMLHFASLISHNLRCIPAYAHLIPTGFFQSLLNNHRGNLYIISQKKSGLPDDEAIPIFEYLRKCM